MSGEELPKGWATAEIREICHLINGRAFKPSDWSKKGLPIVRIQNLNDRGADFNYFEGQLDPRHRISKGELLFAWSGTPGTSFGAHLWYGDEAALNQHIFRVMFESSVVEKSFLRLAINDRLDHLIGVAHGGAGLAHVTKPVFEGTRVKIPPLPEQRRIVAKLDELTGRVRRASEALDAIPALLERYRQSVLAAAFRGELTREWRLTQGPALVTPTKLASDTAVSKRPPGRLWGSGKSLEGPDPSWGQIPESWRWVRISELGSSDEPAVQIGPMSMKSSDFSDDGVVVLNVGSVQWGELDLKKADHLPKEKLAEFHRYQVKPGDVMVTRSGTVGRCAVVPESLPSALMTFHLIRIRPAPLLCDPVYLAYCFRGNSALISQMRDTAIGTTRSGLNTGLLAGAWIPLPPIAEQRTMVEIIQSHFSKMSEMETVTERAGYELTLLTRSLLTRAFRGELVPQDPADEPASVLLERLRAERASAPAAAGRRGRKPKAAQGELPVAPAKKR